MVETQAPRTPIERVHSVVSALALAETLDDEADRYVAAGNGFRANLARNGAEASRRSIGESPSVARIRAALELLEGVTDETLRYVLGLELPDASDPIPTLREIVSRIDDGTL